MNEIELTPEQEREALKLTNDFMFKALFWTDKEQGKKFMDYFIHLFIDPRLKTKEFIAYERAYSIEQIKDYFGHSDTKMIEQVYAPLLAEEKRKKVTKFMADLIGDERTLVPALVRSKKKEINMDDELLNIKGALVNQNIAR